MTLRSGYSPSLFCAAMIASAHGVRGHVKVKCFLDNPAKFNTFSPFFNEKGEESYRVEKVVSQDKDVLIVSFEGVSDRNQAEEVKGTELFVPRSKLPKLSENSFYHHDLIGLQVKSTQGDLLGEIHALHNFGAGDILEIKTCEGKLEMVPFTKEYVPDIHQTEGKVLLSPDGEAFLKEG